MKKVYSRFVAFALAFTFVLGSFSSAFATNEQQKESLNFTLSEKEQTVKEAKNYVDSLKKHFKKVDSTIVNEVEKQNIRVIVEVKGQPIVDLAKKSGLKISNLIADELKKQENKLLDAQKSVQSQMSDSGVESKILNNMTTVINAFSAEVKLDDIQKIAELSNVKNVYIANEYERPNMVTSLDQVVARTAWDLGYTGKNKILAVIDSGIDPDHKDFVMDENADFGMSKEQAQEIITKEKLAGKYYNSKVIYAYNYYDLNHNVKDYGASQHGQHVAGTMAANGD